MASRPTAAGAVPTKAMTAAVVEERVIVLKQEAESTALLSNERAISADIARTRIQADFHGVSKDCAEEVAVAEDLHLPLIDHSPPPLVGCRTISSAS